MWYLSMRVSTQRDPDLPDPDQLSELLVHMHVDACRGCVSVTAASHLLDQGALTPPHGPAGSEASISAEWLLGPACMPSESRPSPDGQPRRGLKVLLLAVSLAEPLLSEFCCWSTWQCFWVTHCGASTSWSVAVAGARLRFIASSTGMLRHCVCQAVGMGSTRRSPGSCCWHCCCGQHRLLPSLSVLSALTDPGLIVASREVVVEPVQGEVVSVCRTGCAGHHAVWVSGLVLHVVMLQLLEVIASQPPKLVLSHSIHPLLLSWVSAALWWFSTIPVVHLSVHAPVHLVWLEPVSSVSGPLVQSSEPLLTWGCAAGWVVVPRGCYWCCHCATLPW